MRYPISNNATHDAFHQQFSGPDSFHVVFSGSEKLSPPDWYHAGQCLYMFPFHISNPGKLTLDITHLYDNYGAIMEQSDQWPVLKQQKVISNLPLEICRGCPSRAFQYQITAGNLMKIRGRYQLYSIGKNKLRHWQRGRTTTVFSNNGPWTKRDLGRGSDGSEVYDPRMESESRRKEAKELWRNRRSEDAPKPW